MKLVIKKTLITLFVVFLLTVQINNFIINLDVLFLSLFNLKYKELNQQIIAHIFIPFINWSILLDIPILMYVFFKNKTKLLIFNILLLYIPYLIFNYLIHLYELPYNINIFISLLIVIFMLIYSFLITYLINEKYRVLYISLNCLNYIFLLFFIMFLYNQKINQYEIEKKECLTESIINKFNTKEEYITYLTNCSNKFFFDKTFEKIMTPLLKKQLNY